MRALRARITPDRAPSNRCAAPKVKAASAMGKKAGFGETGRGWSLNSRAGRTATASSRGG
ncbi:hypothetical protein [Erythrobacter sp. SD-21]|uniref:hypothetical protein n=1 Tax=Erythrobacter sp. SD-21 TaxID=161528 RepID=UPI000153F1A6|nr:hypothetical protein [Erythrobacter sp. SD-21]EDL48962.1 hypothetical protein ED21_24566 [Erythrobacter sp. SD-21]